MKILIQLKDPDALEEQLSQEITDNLFLSETTLSNEEVEAVVEKRKEAICGIASQWFEYGEYLTIEIDTDKETIRVVSLAELKQN